MTIAHFAPHALVPGKRTIVTFSGSRLESASNLWTSFGGRAERIANTNAGLVSFAVSCPEEASGIGALQLTGTNGASNFQLVMADALRTQPHQDKHRSVESAHKISPPVAVDCILKSEKIDYYKFSAKAGEIFSIEVIAHRIGSQMDPVARVLDGEGRELAFCDDEGGVWKDARFRFTAPSNGEFTLAISDVGFGGGTAFDYRLRVTDEPIVWYTYPLVDPAERAASFERIGEGVKRTEGGSPANPPSRPTLSDVPSVFETEPNGSAASAKALGFPAVLNGRIQSGGDVDVFQLIASNGQKLVFQSQSRSLGSPCDLVLRLKKMDGGVIAESDSGAAGDAAITHKFAGDGPFLLEIRELSGASVTNAPYRVEIREFAPGFSVSADDNLVEITPGKEAKLKITATRHEYDGPVELRLDPPVVGITLENNVINEKKKDTELVFKCDASVALGEYHHVRILAKGGDGMSVELNTKPALKKAFPLMLISPSVLDGVIAVVVREK